MKMIPAAEQSKAWVGRGYIIGIAGSNPAGVMDICLLWVLYVVRWRYIRRANHSFGGVLPSFVCLSVSAELQKLGGPGPLGAV